MKVLKRQRSYRTLSVCLILLICLLGLLPGIASDQSSTFNIYLPNYRMLNLNRLVTSKYDLGGRNWDNLTLPEFQQYTGFVSFAYWIEDPASTILMITEWFSSYKPKRFGSSLQLKESKVPPGFFAAVSTNQVPKGDFYSKYGHCRRIATTPKGREIWETELLSFDSKSQHFGVRVRFVILGGTLITFDLQNVGPQLPDINEWARMVDSLQEVEPKRLSRM
jgi:hypothetical protein